MGMDIVETYYSISISIIYSLRIRVICFVFIYFLVVCCVFRIYER